MRIIDADDLIKELQKWDWQDCYLPIHFKELLIDEAPTIKTKEVKYYDEDEKVWKIGEVIVNCSEKPNNSEIPTGSERSNE